MRSFLPALLTLLDVPTEDATWQVLDASQRRQRTLDAVKYLMLREGQEQPLILVFEDLHWIDSETQALLDTLVEGVPSARVLLLVNYRPEYQHRWGSKTYYHQLQIAPLLAEDAGILLEGLVGGDPALHPLKSLLIRIELLSRVLDRAFLPPYMRAAFQSRLEVLRWSSGRNDVD